MRCDDLGRLLQGLLVLWVYLDFMQFLIVWQSDLPQEAAWYRRALDRPVGGLAGARRRSGISCCRSSR